MPYFLHVSIKIQITILLRYGIIGLVTRTLKNE